METLFSLSALVIFHCFPKSGQGMSEEFLDSADNLEFLTDLEKERSTNITECLGNLRE